MVAGHDSARSDAFPTALARLLEARGAAAVDVAWREFVDAYSPIVRQVAQSTTASRDSAMDAYTFVLEQLREQNCRRLRVYGVRENTRFSTWLLVVSRRLCIDFHRQRYGRPQGTGGAEPHAAVLDRATRRRLVDLAAEAVDPDTISATEAGGPESQLRLAQLHRALEGALEGLEPADRLLLALRFEDDRSAAEIARTLGFPTPFHVYRRLTRLLDVLRARLKSRGIHDASP